jgi:transcriptional regulator GlxA family with amidase domain
VRQSETAQFVASVCEGALLLAAAGLLDGYRATTHLAFIPCLKRFSKIKVAKRHPRYVVDGNRITGGGISSGLDEALAPIKKLGGSKVAKSVQRTTQYYPRQPVSISCRSSRIAPRDTASRAILSSRRGPSVVRP